MGAILGKDIKWNFAKFLVDGKSGKVVKKYEPPQSPLSFEQDILNLLK
jgi:glutathione peroxidase